MPLGEYIYIYIYIFVVEAMSDNHTHKDKSLQEIHSLPTENSVGNINNSVGN